jgi:hypothetical protein
MKIIIVLLIISVLCNFYSCSEEFKFEGKWCSYTEDLNKDGKWVGRIVDKYTIEIKKINDKEYNVKFTNRDRGQEGEAENFEGIGVISEKGKSILINVEVKTKSGKITTETHNIGIGKGGPFNTFIGLTWVDGLPETYISDFTRCE